jgi:Zn ribbon nucleic-acid-binding protein
VECALFISGKCEKDEYKRRMSNHLVIPPGFRMMMNGKKKFRYAKPDIKRVISSDPIEIRYTYTIAIDYVHGEVIRRLEGMVGLEKLIAERGKLSDKLKIMRTSITDRSVHGKISSIDKEIEYIQSGNKLKSYIDIAEDIVMEYLELPQYVHIVTDDEDTIIQLDDVEITRLKIIHTFFDVAKKYVPINVIQEKDVDINSCINCGFKMINVAIDDDGQQECPKCGNVICIFSLSGHKGIKSSSGNRTYNVENTYRREILYFIGTAKVHIPEDVFLKLSIHFKNKGFPDPEKIKTYPLDEYGKREGTTLDALLEALKEIGYPSLYKHANAIGRDFWGWKLHEDLRDKIPQLLEGFRMTQRYFNIIDKRGRTSNICSQHRLLQELVRFGVKVCMTDFKLPNESALAFSEYLWKQLCEKALIEYIPLYDDVIISEETGIPMLYIEGATKIIKTFDSKS